VAVLDGKLAAEAVPEGQPVNGTATPHHVGAICDDEGAVHIAVGEGALVIADAALLDQHGAISFMPDHLIGDEPERVKQELRVSLSRLLTLEFDSLLFTHSEPLVGGGKAALREFLDQPPGA
ncbi:MAG TPA: hypothetical protein VNT22_06870, partial [Baekduia sp.]|nr:hypothetical protein [Baekduia sp.]